MIYEVISVLILVDSIIAAIVSFTKVGDNTIEQLPFVKRYLPITGGWAIVYMLLALYIGYLTFFVL